MLPHEQNVDITGCAVTIIRKMGLSDEVKRYHIKEKGIQMIDPDSKGMPFAPIAVKEGSITSFTSGFEIFRGGMAKTFFEASKAFPNVEHIFSTTIQKALSNDDASVKTELSNGALQNHDLLVAADGQWQKVRKQSFAPHFVTVTDKGLYVVYFIVPRLEHDHDRLNVYSGMQPCFVRVIGGDRTTE